jgi:hypothetical protein
MLGREPVANGNGQIAAAGQLFDLRVVSIFVATGPSTTMDDDDHGQASSVFSWSSEIEVTGFSATGAVLDISLILNLRIASRCEAGCARQQNQGNWQAEKACEV